MKYGICLGTPEETVLAAGSVISNIMKQRTSDDVKIHALRAIGQLISPATSATITGCTITKVPMNKKRKK